jgi:ribonuclease HI
MKPRESYGCIPPLKDGTDEIVDNECKAKVFMDTFFPRMAAPEATENPPPKEEIGWEPITKEEVHRALQRMKAMKAPGEDEIPTLVWKQMWPYVNEEIFQIFTASINLGHYPRQWKAAKIVVLRKPNKPDYAIPGAYRPISLLNTLGKVLEAVVAKRLSFYAETYNLLPNTQFGGRPGRNTEQALLVLSNAIDRAWIRARVVTLVAFDLKGAFNGVNSRVLDRQLKAQGIPTIIRNWIASFMQDRTASITFDDFESPRTALDNAGLAQGSPLSPILFIFFNAGLVNQPVDRKGGSSAFIDDYFRWIVGPSAEDNLRKLQEDDIPRIEQWARQTGSSFAAEKTELIHLTRKKTEHSKGQLIIQGTTITPGTTAKLLGVVLDNELRWKPHVQQVLKRATRVNTALGGLRYLRPGQMRQLYQACVTPIVDYASTVWHSPPKDKMHLRALNTVQRTALIRILSAFRSTATATMEVEMFTLPTRLRLRQRAQLTIVSMLTLPRDHPMQEVLSRARRRRDHAGNGNAPRFPLAESMKTMRLGQFNGLETIDPKPTAPWKPPAFKTIDINPDREMARRDAAALLVNPHRVIYSDASGHDNHLGAAAVALDRHQKTVASRTTTIGPMAQWSIHIAELIGIYYAISLAFRVSHQNEQPTRSGTGETITILSDSKSALQAIKNPSNKSGQRVIQAINQSAYELDSQGVSLRLQWIPGHCDDPGNDAADCLAKTAVGPDKTHPFCRPVSCEKTAIRRQILKEWEDEWKTSRKGAHLRRIDGKLPAIHTRRLYQSLPRNRAYLLAQLRTGHSWLATHGKSLQFREDDICECGAKETVTHVLIDCPRLTAERRTLRKEVGEAFGDISLMLGAKGQRTTSSTAQASVLGAVLDFAEASQRFCSRGPKDPPERNPRQRPTTGP